MTVKGEGCMCVCEREIERGERDDRYEENVCESVPAHSHTQFPYCLLPLVDGRNIYGVVLSGAFMSK